MTLNKLAFIGGSGIYKLDVLNEVIEHDLFSSFGQPSTSGGAAALTGTPSFGQAAKIGGGTPAFGSSTPQSTFGQAAATTVAAATAPSTPAPTSGFAAFANKPTGFGAAAAASGGGGFGALASQSGGGGGFAQAAQQASASPFAQQAQQQGGAFGQASSFGNQQQQQQQAWAQQQQQQAWNQPVQPMQPTIRSGLHCRGCRIGVDPNWRFCPVCGTQNR